MNEEILKLKRELEEIKAWKKALEASRSIPLNIDQAFRERFTNLKESNRAANSNDITAVTSVNFVAETVTTSSVLDNPQGFFEVRTNNRIRYIAYFED